MSRGRSAIPAASVRFSSEAAVPRDKGSSHTRRKTATDPSSCAPTRPSSSLLRKRDLCVAKHANAPRSNTNRGPKRGLGYAGVARWFGLRIISDERLRTTIRLRRPNCSYHTKVTSLEHPPNNEKRSKSFSLLSSGITTKRTHSGATGRSAIFVRAWFTTKIHESSQ